MKKMMFTPERYRAWDTVIDHKKNRCFSFFRCIKIALVHDMCEAIVGDITPHCGISVEEKHRREKVRNCCFYEFVTVCIRQHTAMEQHLITVYLDTCSKLQEAMKEMCRHLKADVANEILSLYEVLSTLIRVWCIMWMVFFYEYKFCLTTDGIVVNYTMLISVGIWKSFHFGSPNR